MMKRAYLGESNLVNLCVLSGLLWRRDFLHSVLHHFYFIPDGVRTERTQHEVGKK